MTDIVELLENLSVSPHQQSIIDSAVDEIVGLRNKVLYLFKLLDDIDTADDEAKNNDEFYRNRVRYLHAKRFLIASTDGYKISIHTDLEQQS